jgi:hypothetical protein
LKTKEAWVRVKKVSELRPGVFRVVDCGVCGRTHQMIVARRQGEARRCTGPHRSCRGWDVVEVCDPRSGGLCAEPDCIPEGRLYRLSSAALSETDSTERAPREREEVR